MVGQPPQFLTIIMSLEAACNLTIPDLLCVLFCVLLQFSDKLVQQIFPLFFLITHIFALALFDVQHLKHLTGSPNSCGIVTVLLRAFQQH